MSKTAFITGADRGVGLALAAQLLKKGFIVFAGQYTNAVELEELKRCYGDQIHILPLDISNDESVAKAKSFVTENTDLLDLIINNAAVLGDTQSTILDSLNYTEMMDVFNVNTLGSLRVSQSFMPLLLKSELKILVNISSEAGSIGSCYRESWYAYCMSKAALNIQSKLIHNGIKASGGRVLVMHPGWVQTYMQGKLDARATLTPEQSAASILQVVEGKLAAPAGSSECEFVDYEGHPMSW